MERLCDFNDRDCGLIVWADCGLSIDTKGRDYGLIVDYQL